MVRSANTPFNIEPLEGSSAGRIIPLTGRSAPYRAADGGSISFGTSQRSKLVWNQGNPVATHLVFGPMLDPTTINGIWKERYLGEDVPVQLVETFETLCARGTMCRVSWSTIERIGIVRNFTWQPGTPTGGLHNIGWTMTFQWSRPGGASRIFVPTAAPARQPFRNSLTAVALQAQQVQNTVNVYTTNIGNFAGLPRVTALPVITRMDSIIDSGAAAIESMIEAAGRLGNTSGPNNTDALEQGAVATDAIIDNTHSLLEVTSGADPLRTVDQDDVETLVNSMLLLSDTIDQSYDLVNLAYDTQAELEQELVPDTELEIPAVTGEDLRKVARRFYGRSDDWERIAKYNGIEGSIIPADLRTLVVPFGLTTALDDRIGSC